MACVSCAPPRQTSPQYETVDLYVGPEAGSHFREQLANPPPYDRVEIGEAGTLVLNTEAVSAAQLELRMAKLALAKGCLRITTFLRTRYRDVAPVMRALRRYPLSCIDIDYVSMMHGGRIVIGAASDEP